MVMMLNAGKIVGDLRGGKEDMTEKRFTICIDSNNLKSLWDSERTEEEPLLWLTRSDRIGGIDDVCELLNEQHEQIEDLKDVNVRCCNEYSYFHKRMMELEKENEQLKQSINEVVELLSEEVDLFSDKATEHDINAYVELKEIDNKDAYYMATATKKAIRMLKELQE